MVATVEDHSPLTYLFHMGSDRCGERRHKMNVPVNVGQELTL